MSDSTEDSAEGNNAEQIDIVDEEGAIRIGDIYIPPPPAPACTFDAKGPRLIITHIVSENFKSYAGKQALGPFHKSFSSIVGPNGSGKSNVIDSMLFVFGYKAHKIRSKKISVLIHNSNKYQNVASCTVTVYFQHIIDLPGDDYTEVPDSAFSISRTAFKDNSSYYCINDRRCQFKEVSKLLRQHGVDLDHNRFLILQGEVEQIAMMKPKAQNEHDTGMLEYLEDIIGSSRFKEPIDLLGKRVEELNEQRTEKLNRVKLVEKEKDELEGAKNEAVDYLKKENEIMQLTHVMNQCRLFESTQQQKKLDEEKKEIEVGMKSVTDAIDELKENSAADEDEYKKAVSARDKTAKKLEASKKKYNELEAQDVRCRQDLKHCKNENKKATQTLAQENKKLKDLELQPEKLENEIAELNRKKPSLQTEKKAEEEAVAKVMESLKAETKGFQDEKDVHEAKLVTLKDDVDQAKSKMDLAQLELSVYLSNEEKEKSRLEDMQKKYQELCETLDGKKKSVKEMEKHLPKLKASYDNNSKELAEIIEKERDVSNTLRNKRTKLEETRSAFQASKSRNHVLNVIMDAKNRGIIQGIYGRLGDLGAIDAKYDVAISTACGQLDNIVTDSIDTAQKCVDYLKTNNAGSSTFIGLDKVDRFAEYARRKMATPENVPRLFDLVRVKDDKLLSAFYFALRDTLVADDLTQASRIAFCGSSRNRVVTLKGELIDQSGTMSGGGNRPARGKMGSNVVVSDYNQQDVELMAVEVEKMTEEANNLRRRKEELENKVASESKDGERMEREFEKNKTEINSLCQQEILMAKNISNQEIRVKEVEPDEETVKKFNAALKAATKEYDKAVKIASVVEAEVQRLHSLIMEVCGGKVKAAQKKLENITKKIDELDKAVSKAVVGGKTAEKHMNQTKKKIKTLESDIEENEDRISKLNLELEKIVEDARARLQENDELKTVLEEAEASVSQAKKGMRKMQDELAKLNNEKINVGHKLENCNKKIAENETKIKYWKNEISKIQLHEIEGETLQELPILSDDELAPKNPKDIKYSITLIEDQQKKKKPNVGAIDEYKKKEKLYLQRAAELEQVTDKRNSLREAYEDLRKRRLNEFMTGYGIISNKLKEMYQMITLGGDAELELLDSLDPFTEGIAFSVRPPKKSWKNISNLSGGEKTLSSLALVFALHYYKPTPLYVMDEIDAALDFRNVSIVGNYIKERTRNAQFIVISLRNNMFELADRLVGIYKTNDCTKSVTINPRDIEQQRTDQQTIA